MELRKHLSLKLVFVGLYVVLLATYILIGLQPVEATNYTISTELKIPSIALDSDVTTLQLRENQLDTPDTIVGSYSQARNKTLLIGHSTTVFDDLDEVHLADAIEYGNKLYRVVAIDQLEKSKINMNELLKTEEEDTLVIMTCAGKLFADGDATHRLIITAIEE